MVISGFPRRLMCTAFVVLTLIAWPPGGWVQAADAPAAPAAAPAPVAADGGAAQPILKKGDRLAIVGDSITEQKLYSRYMEDYLTACMPHLELWVIQLGWGGESAGGFLNRMNDDLLSFHPTVVTTCYGMNDGGYRAYNEDIGRNYGNAMKALVTRAKGAGALVVVGSPGAVDTEFFRGVKPEIYNDNLAHLRDIDRKLAADEQMVFANVHDAMIKTMEAAKAALGKGYPVCGRDGFHPSPNGHVIMAYAFLKAMGLDGHIGTFTVDMNGSAKATDGHKVLSAADGKIEIESQRYPFCFYGDEKNPDSTRSIVPFVPFNNDLNRLMLVVENLKTDKAKVTWGKETRSFTRDQLAKGINLAAEFPENPFSEAFRKVDEQVAQEQAFETTMIKTLYRSLGAFQGCLDDEEGKAAIKTLRARLVAKQEALRAAVRAAVVPVRHTVTIVAE